MPAFYAAYAIFLGLEFNIISIIDMKPKISMFFYKFL